MRAAVAKHPGRAPSDTVRGIIAGGIRLLATAFVNLGPSLVTTRMLQSGTAPKYCGWGTGTNAAAVTDAALQTEVAPTTGGDRTACTESQTTITQTNDNYQCAGTVTQTAAGPVAITEAGLLNAASAGTMFIHTVFAAVNTVAGDSILFTFGLKFVPNVV